MENIFFNNNTNNKTPVGEFAEKLLYRSIQLNVVK